MTIRIQMNSVGVDWSAAAEIFEKAPLGTREPETLERTFRNSDVVCFAWDGNTLAGMGRALSDGVVQSVVYDLCMLPKYQGQGLGSTMLKAIMKQAATPNVVLWSVPGKEGFYERFGFRPMCTAMARFKDPKSAADKGYIRNDLSDTVR